MNNIIEKQLYLLTYLCIIKVFMNSENRLKGIFIAEILIIK